MRLRVISDPKAVFNCHYPAQMMALAVFIVLHGGSLRCAAATAGFYAELMGWSYSAPSFKTVSNWVKRCGLHALQLTQTASGEYVGILDATIQIGKEQLLLLLGVPLEVATRLDRPLRVEDVCVLGMEVQNSWNGKRVSGFIERCLARRANLKLNYVICDQGGNLLAALRALTIPVVNDCTHVMMNLVKAIFKDDAALSEWCKQIGRLRQQLNLTDQAFLLPPSLRDQDRFWRIFTLVDWIERVDEYELCAEWRAYLRQKRSRWLDLRLRQVRELVGRCTKILKHEGLSAQSQDRWVTELLDFVNTQKQVTQAAKTFAQGMLDYFDKYAEQYHMSPKLSCCSDIIESIFGRYKNKGGMKAISADVLSIALYSQPLSVEFVKVAMTQVSGPQVEQWTKTNVCENRYGIRKRMEKELKDAGP